MGPGIERSSLILLTIYLWSEIYKRVNKIILLDEPTYALDRDTASDIISGINRIKKEKFILISTHDVDIKQICDKELYIDRICE